MKQPPVWTQAELETEEAVSRTIFRNERLGEPLENWKATFDRYKARFQRLFDEYGIADPASLRPEQVIAIFREQSSDALRYLAGPPISEDDLAVLAEVPSFAPSRLDADPAAAGRILATITQALDTKRFPWIDKGRGPTQSEKSAAILASAALITAQRISTDRRNEGKEAQEQAVKAFLVGRGFTEVPARTIRTLDDAPARGQFCPESLVGTRKADVPVRLFDGRLMPIECKVSNSALNSVKRINNDAASRRASGGKNSDAIRSSRSPCFPASLRSRTSSRRKVVDLRCFGHIGSTV
ncbi:MAG: XamI family restriction endonuclease [Magnetospirillum sp.]|nr:XamI family restriction endonuclease [Magnetospirillum sp.]